MVVVGEAVTLDPVPDERLADGVQEYVVAPVAVKTAEVPEQIVVEFTFTTGGAITVTVAVVVPLQVPVVPTIV